jgi:DNA-binding transcriptional LysR family regulator
MRLDFIGQDRDTRIIRAMAAVGFPVSRSFFPIRTDDPLVYQDLIRAGCGVGGLLCRIGDADPELERIAGLVTLPALPVWLVAAPALRQSPRLRRVWDALATAFPA